MKKILLTCALAFATVFTSFSQEVYPCHTDEKQQELLQSLSPNERAQFLTDAENYEQEILSYIEAHKDDVQLKNGSILYTIPVVFHIIHEGGPENISVEQVENAVMHMNLDYQKLTSNWNQVQPEFLDLVADIQVEFKLAKLDPNGNCTNGITRTYNPAATNGGNGTQQVNAVKEVHGNWPGDKYINIFVAKYIGGAAGYTMYPSTWMGSAMNNGIWVLDNYCGGIGTASSNAIHTLSHEVGHWLNLPHLWGNSNEPGLQSNCNIDDGVADTPLTKGWTSCDLRGVSCDGTLDNVENFMEYSYCSKMFTEGQKARMHAALNSSTGGRNNIWKTSNLNATGVNLPDVLCAADFSAQYREICVGETVDFEDLSYSVVNGWSWEFEGGSPAVSTDASPAITYNTPGVYKVKLTVTDGSSSKSEVKNAYIRVLDNPMELPLIEGFEDYPSAGAQDFWLIENPGNNAKWEVVEGVGYTGNKAFKLANFGQPKGGIDVFSSQPINLSDVSSETGMMLSFRYAFRKRSANNADVLKVYISSTCGTSWVNRKTIKGTQLSSQTAGSSWTPSSQEDWVTVHMTNVTSSYWVDNFRVKFEFESDGGNNIFIDDINLYSGSQEDDPLAIEENQMIQNFSIYPNPADNIANVSFASINGQKVNVDIVNMMGQIVQGNTVQAAEGENLVMLDTQNIGAGVYLVKITAGGTQQVQRLIIK